MPMTTSSDLASVRPMERGSGYERLSIEKTEAREAEGSGMALRGSIE